METPPVNSIAKENSVYAKENSLKRYGIDRWGRDFLRVNEEGRLMFVAPDTPPVDLHELALALERRGIRTPFVLRFPTMVVGQMRRMKEAFEKACAENNYDGGHVGVYPLKVNQRRSVVDTVVAARQQCNYGLEAGSKPELLWAMSQPPVPNSLLLLNGFKDREFVRMAYHAAELGHHVVMVLESVREVRRYLDVGQEEAWRAVPEVGVRAKLYTRGSGRWSGSGGETSKFGLTTGEILAVVRALDAAGMKDRLSLLHFHIGSQITQIKRIKQAVREGTYLYSQLQHGYCPNLRFLDLGGGIGVDYDGSHTSYSSSANYSLDEYASQVVFEIGEALAKTAAKAPTIVTESGRVIAATHSVTITDLREVQGELQPLPEPSKEEHRIVQALRYTLDAINAKNYEEYFHDATDFRDEALSLFSAGYLSIEDRASAEGLFQRIRLKAKKITDQLAKPSEEIVEFLQRAHSKYLANFSTFQSIPDAWSIDQVFPAAPLSRHGEQPTIMAQIVDITCDSDGCIESFAHPDENMKFLPLHERRSRDERYYLGFFMTGAYQDSLSNVHNLFSRCHEVVIRGPDDEKTLPGSEWIELTPEVALEVKMGATNEDVLSGMDFDVEHVLSQVRDRHVNAETTLGQSWVLGLLQSYPYLAP